MFLQALDKTDLQGKYGTRRVLRTGGMDGGRGRAIILRESNGSGLLML